VSFFADSSVAARRQLHCIRRCARSFLAAIHAVRKLHCGRRDNSSCITRWDTGPLLIVLTVTYSQFMFIRPSLLELLEVGSGPQKKTSKDCSTLYGSEAHSVANPTLLTHGMVGTDSTDSTQEK